MRNDKIIPGMILVLLGTAFLLHNFGYIHFHWENFAFLWPLFIVIGGVSLLLSFSHSTWASVTKAVLIIGGFALILFGDFKYKRHWWSGWGHHNYTYNSDNDDNDDNDDSDNNNGKSVNVAGDAQFNHPFEAGIKIARLNISGGATTFKLNDTTNQLFAAQTKSFHGKYQFDSHRQDSVYIMDFHMKENHVWNWGNHDDDKNSVSMSLNTRPEWEMNIEAGATDLDFDLSKYKMRDVTLKGGAAQFTLKMGQPLANSNITVETGASDVTINIPQDAACTIESSSGLSSTDYPGFTKKDNGNYETDNFTSAKNKYYIHISGGVSDFKVHKY